MRGPFTTVALMTLVSFAEAAPPTPSQPSSTESAAWESAETWGVTFEVLLSFAEEEDVVQAEGQVSEERISAGIKALSLDFRESERQDKWRNRFRFFAIDGSSLDVFPAWEPPESYEEPE